MNRMSGPMAGSRRFQSKRLGAALATSLGALQGAATLVLAHFFPAEAADLAAQLQAAGLSRMYGGIHYRFDITAGVQIGTSAAELALAIDGSLGMLSVIH